MCAALLLPRSRAPAWPSPAVCSSGNTRSSGRRTPRRRAGCRSRCGTRTRRRSPSATSAGRPTAGPARDPGPAASLLQTHWSLRPGSAWPGSAPARRGQRRCRSDPASGSRARRALVGLARSALSACSTIVPLDGGGDVGCAAVGVAAARRRGRPSSRRAPGEGRRGHEGGEQRGAASHRDSSCRVGHQTSGNAAGLR